MKTFEQYSELLPLAIDWLQSVERNCLTNGLDLTGVEIQEAKSVGVLHAERIKVLAVSEVSKPVHPELLKAAIEIGMLGDDAAARAIGYGIEVVEGYSSRELLRHEFRHVYQFEQAGSLEMFISAYIKSVLADGYYNSEFERDARRHELP